MIQWCCGQRNPEAGSRVEEETWNIGSRLQNQEALQWAVLGWGQPLGACSKAGLKERESCGSRGFCGSWQPLKAHRAFTSLFLSLQLPLMLADCMRGSCKAGPGGGGGKQASHPLISSYFASKDPKVLAWTKAEMNQGHSCTQDTTWQGTSFKLYLCYQQPVSGKHLFPFL